MCPCGQRHCPFCGHQMGSEPPYECGCREENAIVWKSDEELDEYMSDFPLTIDIWECVGESDE
jgi:hypothetical protein